MILKRRIGKQKIIMIKIFKVRLDIKKLVKQKINIHQITLNITVE